MKKHLVLILLIIAIIISGTSIYFLKLSGKPQSADEAEINKIISAVSKHITLPEEEPSVATVSDLEALRDRPFFAKAKEGDKVLIYEKAKKAILYRPSEDKIIDIAPINP